MAFFSVIIPVYNKVKTLNDSLKCLYRQTFKNFEVIAVDDGSTDGSLDVLREHQKAGLLKLFQRSSPGPGGYAARNFGAEKSTGQWLVFFDADDIMLFDHLSYFANAISHHSDIELFVNAYQKIEGQRRLPCIKGMPIDRLSRLEALRSFARFDFIHMNGACISRERFLSMGGFPAGLYRRGGDVYFWLKVLCELKAIHYNASVTSLWLLENSDITRDKRNLIGLHPGVDLLKEYEPILTHSERRQLRLAINRKVLSWAVEKKQLGQSVRLDLEALKLGGMNMRLWLHAISLLVPQPYYDQLRSRIK
ncbi:glycosyltransferase family 2 protein [Vreelandella andesensis]|uniref:Glycosyltransferase family 2 protein n=1 Tax=Vreelandella andesensis TaxID=447567 RepID=A0A3S0YEL3_9GAMM|nr:glycosyltransferase family 2 protein [Halomonas andesensis]RUR28304.1 glycosyltransferase family 2 protein [Halomonas andesensis]